MALDLKKLLLNKPFLFYFKIAFSSHTIKPSHYINSGSYNPKVILNY